MRIHRGRQAPYFLKVGVRMDKEQLLAELKKLSKRANQRLVRLEKELGGDTVDNRAYLQIEQLAEETGRPNPRIRTAKSMTISEIRKEIRYAQRFLDDEFSQVKTIKQQLDRYLETDVDKAFAKRFNLKTVKEMNRLLKFFNNAYYSQLKDIFGSDEIIDLRLQKVEMSDKQFLEWLNVEYSLDLEKPKRRRRKKKKT